MKRHKWSPKIKVRKRSWYQVCENCGMTKEPHYPMGTLYSHASMRDGFDFRAGDCKYPITPDSNATKQSDTETKQVRAKS